MLLDDTTVGVNNTDVDDVAVGLSDTDGIVAGRRMCDCLNV